MAAISIIIPVHNQEENIKMLVNRISSACKKTNISYEIIFIDNHSNDSTAKVISFITNLFPITYIKNNSKKNKINSFIESFHKAKYDIFCIAHAPQNLPEKLIELVEILEKGVDLAFDHEMILFKREVFEKTKSNFPANSKFDNTLVSKAKNAGFIVKDLEFVESSKKLSIKSKDKNVLKIVKKIFLTTTVIAIFVITALLLYQYRHKISLPIFVKPEAFTEVYFENNENLPIKTSHNPSPTDPHKIIDTYSFTFTIHNLENVNKKYTYEVYALNTKKTFIDQRDVFIRNKGKKTIVENFQMPDEHQRTEIVINLAGMNEQIDFWMPSIGNLQTINQKK